MIREFVVSLTDKHDPDAFKQFDDKHCIVKKLTRCKDCYNAECEGGAGTIVCGITGDSHDRLFYCAYGQQREEEEFYHELYFAHREKDI